MNLAGVLEHIKESLESTNFYKQVESYEGQFEDPKNYIILPPAVFIDVIAGSQSSKIARNHAADIDLYVCTDSLYGKPNTANMLDTIDSIKQHLQYSKFPGHIVAYNGFEKIGNFPGFKIYKMSFRID
jgi:phage gp37-like protein